MEVTSTKASIEAFISVMRSFADVIKTFREVTSTEVFIEAAGRSSMEDIKELEASTDDNSTERPTKASTNASMEATSTNCFLRLSWK